MNLDDRARRAAGDLRREVGEADGSAVAGRDPFDRLERSLARRARNQRVATIAVTATFIGVSVFVLGRAFAPERGRTPSTTTLPSGSILYGEWDERISQARWRIVRSDGTGAVDLGVVASCARWFPDGSRVLITNDAERGPGSPLRPAVVDAGGSLLEVLDATTDPDLELGCGDVSPDGETIVLEGFNEVDTARNGIYTIRASDGGGLVRLTEGGDCCPQFSPDGTRAVFMRTRPGVQPDGAGAVFVVDVDGTDVRRLTPWGSAFLGTNWSPDGEWIAFQRPYGRLFLVRPDGTGLHEVPLRLPRGAGASEPSWSPDGGWIVFVVGRDQASDLYAVRPDGTDLTRITASDGIVVSGPDWRPPALP